MHSFCICMLGIDVDDCMGTAAGSSDYMQAAISHKKTCTAATERNVGSSDCNI